jgi:hypothetical protein
MIPEEVWKESPLYPGVIASSHGRIRTEVRFVPLPNGGERPCETKPTFGCITSANKTARHVYFGRYIKGVGNVKVHRAVCSAFHGPPPDEKCVVIHVNENGLDNRPENVRWGSQKENLNMPSFKEYNRRAKKVLVGRGDEMAPKTSDIYPGLPHFISLIRERRS